MAPDRRVFVSYILTGLGVLATRRYGFAQSRASQTVPAIERNTQAVRQLIADIREVGPGMDLPQATGFANRESELRRQLAGIIRTIPAPARDEYVLPDQRPLVSELEKAGIPLVPADSDLAATPLRTPGEADCKETLRQVVIDVVL